MPIAIVGGARTPFTKIGTTLKAHTAIDLGVAPVDALAKRFDLAANPSGLLAFGTVIQHSDVSNLAREVALESALHPETRAFSTVLACATSLSTAVEAAGWISRGLVPWAIAGGSESMSNFPVSFSHEVGRALRDAKFARSTPEKLKSALRLRPRDLTPRIPPVAERLTGLTMGEHCERMAREWKIPREEQDAWAVESHRRAAKAAAWHAEAICPPRGETARLPDNLVRGDTTPEKAAKLKPAFAADGTITAANASPLTDGGAAVLLADLDYAREKDWPVAAILADWEFAAVDIRNEGLLMAPVYAMLRLFARQERSLDDFDIVEIHEAFAAQVLCNLKALANAEWCKRRLGLPPTQIPPRERINPHGGSIPLGHPFGATGARLLWQAARELQESREARALVSICAAGGLGLVATLTRPEASA